MTFDASRMLAFDLETTSANPKEARIVTSALVRIDGRDVQKVEHLADPGIEIPEEATNVHGITTEKARAEGRPHEEVLKDTVAAIKAAWEDGLTLIVYNAAFDLTVLRSLTGDFTVTGPVYRGAVCERGGGELGNAHEATADALAAARVAWKQVRQHYPNLAQMDENELMEFQAVKWYEDRTAFKKYLEGKGRDASDVSTAWPLIG